MSEQQHQAKTVLITGCSRGIGLSFAQHYTQQGWNVIGAVRDPARAQQLQQLNPYKLVRLDIGDEQSIVHAAEELINVPIDLLINNAGIVHEHTIATASKESLMRLFEVNAVGPFLVTRALLPNLKLAAQRPGSPNVVIAHLSSRLGSIACVSDTEYFGYRTSKAAVNMVNAGLALELRSDEIASVVLHPGYVATDMSNHMGTVRPNESVRGLATVIENISLEQTGKFYDFKGTELPW